MSLKCNQCASGKSWDDCKTKEMACPKGMDELCVKVYVKYGDIESYAKYCGSKDYCDKDKNPTCKLAKAVKDVECSIDCCKGDLCNAGSAAKISGIVLVACALASLVFKSA